MISYAPLFETMAQKGITSYRLEKMGFSRATYYSIKFCTLLHCEVSDVMEFIEVEEAAD